MKYCQTCGSEINDLAEICPKCGVRCAIKQDTTQQVSSDKPIKGTGLGVVFGLFLGLIGALLCHFLGDDSAKKASWITFGCVCAAGVLIFIISLIASLAVLY